jgi:hypothetical protein
MTAANQGEDVRLNLTVFSRSERFLNEPPSTYSQAGSSSLSINRAMYSSGVTMGAFVIAAME